MAGLLDDPRLDWALLDRYGFESERFATAAAQIASGHLSEKSSVIQGTIEPVDDVVNADYESNELRALGEAALAEGHVATCVLNGGMATRFGGVVKGVVEVFGGQSFLALKARDARLAAERWGQPVPLVLMNSFATSEATAQHVAAAQGFGLATENILTFHQSISLRLTQGGELFIGKDGKPSYHAPGHGDFFACLRNSGVLAQLRQRGVRVLLFSNVDNLGATIDPVIIGHHLREGRPFTAELTQKQRTASGAWDKGGAPAKVNGRRQLVEGFRFPGDFAQERLPDFSTNNMLFTLEAIDRPVPLTRHVVKKSVDGQTALQLESITCEASAVDAPDGTPLLPMTLLRVPREGPRGRFFPVKEPEDLGAMRDVLRQRLA